MNRKHTISVLLENKTGALARIAGLFSGRGYNIESLTVSPTQDSALSKMIIVTYGDDDVLEQIDKQLNKLVNVKQVTDLTLQGNISRELILVKVKTEVGMRHEILEIANTFKASVVNIERDSVILEVTGNSDKIDSFVELMSDFGIIDLARTGKVALVRS